MRFLLLALAALIVFAGMTSAQKLTAKDLRSLEGSKWIGTLTYLDYRSNKKTSIKSNLTVTRKPGAAGVWIFAYEYPDEPNANGSSDVALLDDGKTFNEQTVIETNRLKGQSLRIVSIKDGTDNDKKAKFRYTYLLSEESFSIKKEVQLEGSSDWFERNTYSWAR